MVRKKPQLLPVNKRIERIQKELKKRSLDAILISSSSHIAYLTGYGGFSDIEREAFMFISLQNALLFTDRRYLGALAHVKPTISLKEISLKNPLSRHVGGILRSLNAQRVGIEKEHVTVEEYENLNLSSVAIPHSILADLRQIKTKEEIALLQKACDLTDKAYARLLSYVKPGISEKELAAKLEYWIKKQGADVAFPPIIAFGKNSATPHHKTGDQRLAIKDHVLIDFGVRYQLYCSDMTRVVFVGKPSDEQKRMYQTVHDAGQKALDFLSSDHQSVQASRVDDVARRYIISKGYPSIPHSLGHGVGIEVHESPRISPVSKDILKQGMVFTIEPGIYDRKLGGVRIEDVVVLEKKGPSIITHSPKSLTIL